MTNFVDECPIHGVSEGKCLRLQFRRVQVRGLHERARLDVFNQCDGCIHPGAFAHRPYVVFVLAFSFLCRKILLLNLQNIAKRTVEPDGLAA
ncbi:hypothetical protein [Aliiroseovarius halocynthiae]|uniref:Uncharacterized protein n=1 Tax=Aliiroseovarius halocynthiae TaxID=985055 RepID=A0A545SXX2_9RHOB|nr:hypothetical protein [Aliiroseovarius halocynthiae]TQV69811.1 hypothetical protein FIL88_01700 [Aliiroseovarius halocynthiae]